MATAADNHIAARRSEIPPQGDEIKSTRSHAWLAIILMLTVGVQTFHMVEHAAQMVQDFILKSDTTHGLVGQLDLEIVHFAFNTVYAIGFLIIFIMWLRVGKEISPTYTLTTAILAIGLFSQTYHQVEHSVRYAQHLTTGIERPPGLIGDRFNQIVAHFLMNGIVYIPILWVYFIEGFHVRVMEMLPDSIARRWG